MKTEVVREGETELEVPKVRGQPSSRDPVFYNPAMDVSRDLTVAYAASVDARFVCDPLAGVGARGVRIAVECDPEVVVLNDANPTAVEFIARNVRRNGVEDVCRVENRDANALMFEDELAGRFHYVDVDPFGPPVPFADAAVRTVANRGGLGVTATDTSALAGRYPRAARRKYWVHVRRVEFYHEVAMRALVGFLVRTCARYDRAFEPSLTVFHRHHVRVFGRVRRGAGRADEALRSLGYVLWCPDCGWLRASRRPVSECPGCGRTVRGIGPLWLDDTTDPDAAGPVLSECERRGFEEAATVVGRCLEEVGTRPWAYDVHSWASRLGLSEVPPVDSVLKALRDMGFKAVIPHYSRAGRVFVKTDAGPRDFENALLEASGEDGS